MCAFPHRQNSISHDRWGLTRQDNSISQNGRGLTVLRWQLDQWLNKINWVFQLAEILAIQAFPNFDIDNLLRTGTYHQAECQTL